MERTQKTLTMADVAGWGSAVVTFGLIQGALYLKAYWGHFGLDPFQFVAVSELALAGLAGIGMVLFLMLVASLFGGWVEIKVTSGSAKSKLFAWLFPLLFFTGLGLLLWWSNTWPLLIGLLLTIICALIVQLSPVVPATVKYSSWLIYALVMLVYVSIVSSMLGSVSLNQFSTPQRRDILLAAFLLDGQLLHQRFGFSCHRVCVIKQLLEPIFLWTKHFLSPTPECLLCILAGGEVGLPRNAQRHQSVLNVLVQNQVSGFVPYKPVHLREVGPDGPEQLIAIDSGAVLVRVFSMELHAEVGDIESAVDAVEGELPLLNSADLVAAHLVGAQLMRLSCVLPRTVANYPGADCSDPVWGIAPIEALQGDLTPEKSKSSNHYSEQKAGEEKEGY